MLRQARSLSISTGLTAATGFLRVLWNSTAAMPRPVVGGADGDGWAERDAVEGRLARELEIDPDAYVLAIQDARGRNPFDLL